MSREISSQMQRTTSRQVGLHCSVSIWCPCADPPTRMGPAAPREAKGMLLYCCKCQNQVYFKVEDVQ
jgi:hypothetical protein